MQPADCPHCGAPAGNGFFCDACGGAMFSSPGAVPPEAVLAQRAALPPDAYTPAAGEPPEYVAPGDARAAAQAYPPGSMGQMPPPGYPLPPGTVPYRPPQRTAPKGLVVSRRAFVAAVAGFLALVLASVGLVFLLKPDPAPVIKVPTPAGWEDMSGFFREMREEDIETALNGGKLDAYAMNSTTFDVLIALSYDSSHYSDVPPQNASLEVMAAWIDQNRKPLEEDFLSEFAEALEIDTGRIDTEKLEAVRTGSGDTAIHILLYTYDQKTRSSAAMNTLIFSKSDTIYMVAVLASGGSTGESTMKYLIDSITFE